MFGGTTIVPAMRTVGVLVITALMFWVGCGDSESNGDGGSGDTDCRGACPSGAELRDSNAACAELGAGNAYCFKQNGSLETSVNCSTGGSGLAACLNDEVCTLNADNSEATCG